MKHPLLDIAFIETPLGNQLKDFMIFWGEYLPERQIVRKPAFAKSGWECDMQAVPILKGGGVDPTLYSLYL